jgi:LysR family transcriptional regulator, glycine cleavage system transcriptional activator
MRGALANKALAGFFVYLMLDNSKGLRGWHDCCSTLMVYCGFAMRLPSLKFLKTFQVAARLQSFKAAAAELCVTPSAISHQIKALEQQLGVSLFQRGVRTLTLTDAGTHYLEHLNDIFSKLETVTEQLQVRYGRSIIRLNVPPFFANEMLLPRLASFSQAREETDIRIETTFSAPKTHPPDADLSIVVGAGPWEGLTVHELFAQSFIAACSPAFLLENPIDTYGDLNGKTLLLHEERREAWERWALGLGIEPIKPNRLVRLDTMSAVVRAAEQGVGVALVPARLSADRFSGGGLVKLFDAELTTNESYVLLHRPEDRAREDLQELTQWILSECRVA